MSELKRKSLNAMTTILDLENIPRRKKYESIGHRVDGVDADWLRDLIAYARTADEAMERIERLESGACPLSEAAAAIARAARLAP